MGAGAAPGRGRHARHLPRGFSPSQGSLSLSTRLLLAVPILNMGTGIMAAGFSTDALGPGGRIAVGIAVALAVTLSFSLVLTILLRRSLALPLADLLGAMDRIKQGDLDAQLPPMSADEMANVIENFNSMVEGLQERDRLAEENERLLEEVRASRARLVSASDAERRQMERSLHEGAQQRLSALALRLRMLQESSSWEPDEIRAMAGEASAELTGALDDLRELGRDIHPQVLSESGLAQALEQLARRSPVPVTVSATDERYPSRVESTAYFAASEALDNVEKYARAQRAQLSAQRRNGLLVIEISDDGVGGADPQRGSGLAGLADRVAALDGRLRVESPAGYGTKVTVELPVAFATQSEHQG